MGEIMNSIAKASAEREIKKEIKEDKPKYDHFYRFVPTSAINDVISAYHEQAVYQSVNHGYTSIAESKAVSDLKNRKDSDEGEYRCCPPTLDCDEMLKYLTMWFEEYHRPELITERVLKGFSLCAKSVGKERYQDSVNRVVESTSVFHKKYLSMIDKSGKALTSTAKSFNEHFVTGETTGLGFGLITTSVTDALLYKVMDDSARDKQIGAQMASAYRASKDVFLKEREKLFISAEHYYKEYCAVVKQAVNNIYGEANPEIFDEEIKRRLEDEWAPYGTKITEKQQQKELKEKERREREKRAIEIEKEEKEAKQKRRDTFKKKGIKICVGVIIALVAILSVLTIVNSTKASKVRDSISGHIYKSEDGHLYVFEDEENCDWYFKEDSILGYGDYTVKSSPFGVVIDLYVCDRNKKLKAKDINESGVPGRIYDREELKISRVPKPNYYLME